ncbi:MAG: hypothetical protein COA94_07345 [Rickettsiales bacterium]|nr:MAG: hypothetical protein COA94_07345 [Rickettsiales bacterium]
MDVTVAAYYIKEEKISYSEYIDNMNIINKAVTEMQKNLMQDYGVYKKTRFGILVSSIQKIIAIDQEFKDLLFFMGLINYKNISRDLLINFKNEKIVNNFIAYLKEFSIITEERKNKNNKIDNFTILKSSNIIIRHYLQQLLFLGECRVIAARGAKILQQYLKFNEKKLSSIDRDNYYEHIEAFLQNKDLLDNDILAYYSKILGIYYVGNENYDKAKKLLENALEYYNLNKKMYGKEIANISVNSGELYLFSGGYEKAKKSLEIARQFYSQNIEEYECVLSWTYGLMGYTCRALEQYEQARIYLDKSLAIHSGCSNFDKKTRLLTYLGSVHRNLGNYDLAITLLTSANNLIIDFYGKNHFKKYWIDNYLGQTYLCKGEYLKAKELLEVAVIKYQNLYGKKDKRTAEISIWLGTLKSYIGEYAESQAILSFAHKRFVKIYPENHLKIAWCATSLGEVYRQLKEYDLSQRYLEQAQAIFSLKLAKNNIKIAWNTLNLGLLYRDQNKLVKAEQYFQKSFDIYMKNNGLQHKRTATVLAELGYIKFLKGDSAAGSGMIKKALRIMVTKNYTRRYIALIQLAEINFSKLKNNLSDEEKRNITNQTLLYMNQALEIVTNNFPSSSTCSEEIQYKMKQYQNRLP